MTASPAACPSCAAPLSGRPGERFCGACGTALPQTCPACAAPVAPAQAFCASCGTRIASVEPRPVRRRGQERRTVSVLFVDVVGWTSLAERLDPEDLRAAQSDFFAEVRRVVARHGGTLEKYLGDAVLACFGAPRATEDDTLRAVRAALDVRTACGGRSVAGTPLEVRIGVATGEALVDLDADPARGQAFVTGDVVNLAARLQAAAPPGTVLVAQETAATTGDRVDYEPAGELVLRGKAAPVSAYLAQGLIDEPQPVRRFDTPLVGRTPQLRLLASCLARVVADGCGALVTVVGEPGVGKSRLVGELRRQYANPQGKPRPGQRPVRWLAGGVPRDADELAPLAETLRAWAALVESDATADPAAQRNRFDAAVLDVVPGSEGWCLADSLAPMLGLPSGAHAGRSAGRLLDPTTAWRQLLIALAEAQPTVLVLEDLHRASPRLLAAVEELLAVAAEVPLLVVVTAWPELLERRPGWGSNGQDVVTLTLPPLDEKETAHLLAGLLADVPLAPSVFARLVSLSGGNPLYAEECAGLLRDGVNAQLARQVSVLPLPRSVRGIVASRLDLLSDAELAALQAAAVLGERCWPGAVSALTDLPHADAEAALSGLVRRGLLRRVRPSSLPSEPEYAFRSTLVRELVYQRLPRTRRLGQHRRAAEWWQRQPDELPPSDGSTAADVPADVVVKPATIALHRVVAADLAVALHAAEADDLTEQARQALCALAHDSDQLAALLPVRASVERMLAAWPPKVDPVDRWACIRLSEEVAFVADRDGYADSEGPSRVRTAATALLELGELAEAAHCHTLLGQVAWWQADRPAALAEHARAVELLDGQPPSEQQALALAELARLQMLAFDTGAAQRTSQRALAVAETLDLPEVAANALCTWGAARYIEGDAGGIEQQERALELARRRKLAALARVANNLAHTLQEEGELRRSWTLLDEALAVGATAGTGLHSFRSEPEAALRAYYEGDWARALMLADSFLDRPSGGPDPWEPHLRGLRGLLRRLRGEPAESLPEGLPAALADSFPQVLRPVLALTARCALLDADNGSDEGALRLADELYAELDAHWEAHWRETADTPSKEWLPSAVTVAGALDVRLGGDRTARLLDRLRRSPRRTRWVQAGEASARAALAALAGDTPAALAVAEEAVAVYDSIGDESERGFAVATAANLERELGGRGRWDWELAAFVSRTGAMRLAPAASSAAALLLAPARQPETARERTLRAHI